MHCWAQSGPGTTRVGAENRPRAQSASANQPVQVTCFGSGDWAPETAQAIFVQFKNVLEVSRKKLPFGIAQIGKAFRNEINPRNFTFRSREFEQMELEYFCRAQEGAKLLDYWREERLKFYSNIGIPREKLHVLTVPGADRARRPDPRRRHRRCGWRCRE